MRPVRVKKRDRGTERERLELLSYGTFERWEKKKREMRAMYYSSGRTNLAQLTDLFIFSFNIVLVHLLIHSIKLLFVYLLDVIVNALKNTLRRQIIFF